MKNFILCTALLCFSSYAFAQKPPSKFGEVTIEDLKMQRYDKDTSAAAVVLVDYGESVINYDQNNGFYLNFERLTRIKILTKDGFEHANISIPLYHDSGDDEKLTGFKAVTYNLENGKMVETKLKNDAIFKEKYDNNVDFVKVTLPNVKEGSVIEVTYKILSDFLFNYQDWEFQREIPTAWSEYRARVPQYFNYDKYMQGYVSLSVNESSQVPASISITTKERTEERYKVTTTFNTDKIDYQESRFRWAAKDVPAFKEEPYITTPRDYISKINFELAFTQFPDQPMKKYMGSWEDINKQYVESENFGGQIEGNGFLKKTVEEITAGMTTPESKLMAIHQYVKQNVQWDGNSRKFISSSLKKVLDDKKGNSADINLLLASMLDKAGFEVNPVLLSTRDHGFVRETTPISSQFNYVITEVKFGDKFLLVDATDKYLPLGLLPERCLNGNGFLVAKEGFQWVKLQAAVKSKITSNLDFKIAESGEMKGLITIDKVGYDAANTRKSYFTKGEEEYIKEMLASRSWELSKSEFQNAKELGEAFKEVYEADVKEHITSAGNVMYVNPFLMGRTEANPFTIENRQYPVDYGSPLERIYLLKLTIPDGYDVDELPQSKVLTIPQNGGKYLYNMTRNGNTINLTSIFQINKGIFAQTEYPNLREFYNQMVAKQAEQIVLKKK
jgi:hypothetical protein